MGGDSFLELYGLAEGLLCLLELALAEVGLTEVVVGQLGQVGGWSKPCGSRRRPDPSVLGSHDEPQVVSGLGIAGSSRPPSKAACASSHRRSWVYLRSSGRALSGSTHRPERSQPEQIRPRGLLLPLGRRRCAPGLSHLALPVAQPRRKSPAPSARRACAGLTGPARHRGVVPAHTVVPTARSVRDPPADLEPPRDLRSMRAEPVGNSLRPRSSSRAAGGLPDYPRVEEKPRRSPARVRAPRQFRRTREKPPRTAAQPPPVVGRRKHPRQACRSRPKTRPRCLSRRRSPRSGRRSLSGVREGSRSAWLSVRRARSGVPTPV
jgi:hypothetical protein